MEYFSRDKLMDKMSAWLDELRDNELSDNTLKRYKINITSFINFIDGKPVCKNSIIEFKTKLEDVNNYLVNTSNNYLTSVNKFLKYLELANLCVNPFKVQRKDSAEDYINYTDYHRLLRYALSKDDIKSYVIIRILGETGIRIAELKFFRVEILNEHIVVKNKGKTRTIILKKELLSLIRKYAKENHIYSGYLFPGRNKNQPLHDSSVRKRLKKVAGGAKVKLSKVHPHSFRHYFAVQYLAAYPDDIVTLSDLLGHAKLETTRIYVRLSNTQKEQKLRNVKF